MGFSVVGNVVDVVVVEVVVVFFLIKSFNFISEISSWPFSFLRSLSFKNS